MIPRFREGEIHDVVVKPLRIFSDERGWLAELFRSDGVDAAVMPAMAYVSMSRPGVARGPHEHREQSDYFCFMGPSNFKIYLWDARPSSASAGIKQVAFAGADAPALLVVPPGVVHAYRNVGAEEGMVFNCPNRLYAGHGRHEPVDEIRHEEVADSPYLLD